MRCRSKRRPGVPYSSSVKTKNDAGVEVSVMHACGHDIHMTSFLGTAKMLTELKNRWSGTLVLLGQPAEETGDGANAMLRDKLYTNFPRPDFAIALHDKPELETGKVGYTPGYAMASATSIDIKIRGIGGHGSAPEATKDPIVVGGAGRDGTANDRQPREFAARSGSGYSRLNSRRHALQHHSR